MSRFKDSWDKAKILLSQLLCIGAVFTACTDDEVFNQTNKALQVSVSTEAPAESRVIIDGGYLPDGASIGVTLTAEDGSAYDGQEFTNLQYTATGVGSAQTWNSATPASLSITNGKVIAYYPYYGGEDFDLKAVPVETASQTDYMYAKPVTGINMVSPAANLTMQHAMTDIRINIKKGTYTGTGEVTKITAKSPAFATSAIMDVETGVFANVSGGGAQFVQELAGAAISSGNVVHDFLIVPDAKSTSGEVAIFVIIDDKKFAVTVPYTETFQQGFAYTYNLTLDNAALTLDGVSVAKWGVKAEVDESLQFVDDQYIVEIQVPSDNYTYYHNIVNYDVEINWGDGTSSSLQNKLESNNSSAHPSHTYEKAGTYQIKVEGKIKNINSQYASKIISKIIYIGKDCDITSMKYAFFSQGLLKTIPEGVFDKCTEVTTFEAAFQDCDALTTIPEGLFDKCTKVKYFKYTFWMCENLQTIPEGLFDNCTKVTNFEGVFGCCPVIKSIPEGLFDKCTEVTSFKTSFGKNPGYTNNFDNKIITSIPKGLFDKCTKVETFENAFYSCESLQAIPVGLFDNNTEVRNFSSTFCNTAITSIPSGLFDNCTKVTNFGNTFASTGITSIPEGLFDKCTEVTSFKGTFQGCTSLKNIPTTLFDNNTKVKNFGIVFAECKKITLIPEGLFDKCTEVTSFSGAFRNTNIANIPEGLFDKCTEVTNFGKLNISDLYGVFEGCKNLTTIPEGLFDHCTKVTEFDRVFNGCTNLQAIPTGLFDNCTEVTSFNGTFWKCTSLQTIPEGLFDKCTEVTDFRSTFNECTSLASIPEGLFDKCTKVTYFQYAFYQCDNLGGESPYTVIQVDGVDTKVHLYERENYPDNFVKPTSNYSCFYKCTNLTDYNSIPSGWKSY